MKSGIRLPTFVPITADDTEGSKVGIEADSVGTATAATFLFRFETPGVTAGESPEARSEVTGRAASTGEGLTAGAVVELVDTVVARLGFLAGLDAESGFGIDVCALDSATATVDVGFSSASIWGVRAGAVGAEGVAAGIVAGTVASGGMGSSPHAPSAKSNKAPPKEAVMKCSRIF